MSLSDAGASVSPLRGGGSYRYGSFSAAPTSAVGSPLRRDTPVFDRLHARGATGTPGAAPPPPPPPYTQLRAAPTAFVPAAGAASPLLQATASDRPGGPPVHYKALLARGFSVHGFKCGAEVAAARPIVLNGAEAVAEGAAGVVWGPGDDGDTRRLLVSFDAFHTALNVFPSEVTLVREYPSKCPSCGTGLPPVPRRGPAAGGAQAQQRRRAPGQAPRALGLLTRAAVHPVLARYLAKWKVWLVLRRPTSVAFALYAPEGMLPPPPEEEGVGADAAAGDAAAVAETAVDAAEEAAAQPVRVDDDGVEFAPEGFLPPPDEEVVGAEPPAAAAHPAPEDVAPSGEPLERNAFYDRHPEVRPTRAALRALQRENDELKRQLAALQGGGAAAAPEEPSAAAAEAAVAGEDAAPV